MLEMTKHDIPDTILTKILDAHSCCIQAGNKALLHARQAGELLNQAKESCSHGTWGEWIDENLTFSARTAQLYMKIGREWDKLTNAQSIAVLSLSDAAKLLAEPKSVKPEPMAAPFELEPDEFLRAGNFETVGWFVTIEPCGESPGYYYLSGVDDMGVAFANHRPVSASAVCLLLSRSGFTFERMTFEKMPYSGKPDFHNMIMSAVYPCEWRTSRTLCRHCDATWQTSTCEHVLQE